ncbi:tail fiber domain-containing protein, partial [Candidatus Babeliales bacterium]|nr:tail fiber domain-containing protein [Candidatus Babeliales bacterium]
ENALRVQVNGSSKLVVTSGGTVGVRTASPGSTYALYVTGNAYATGTWSGSDKRWKKNISPIPSSLDKITGLSGVEFDWRTDEFPDHDFDSGRQIGFIAQDVLKVLPELVKQDDKGYYSIEYSKVVPVLVNAVKEQQQQIDKQQEQINMLIKELEELKK